MFGRPLPWGRDPLPDMHSLLNTRSRHRHPRTRMPSPPDSRELPTSTRHRSREHRQPSTYPKHLRFSDLSTPPSTTSSSSEWEQETYLLDDDDDDDDYDITDTAPHHLPRFTPTPTRPRRAPRHSPDVRRTSVTLPRATAASLRSNELLLLPPLTHLHVQIRMRAPYAAQDETLRVAVPGAMQFGDVVSGVLATCFGEGVRSGRVVARVRLRGQWREVASSLALEEVVSGGEVFGEGRREVEVKIEVGDDGERERAGGRFGGRGPRAGGFGVERVLEREESRFRVGI